MIVFGLYNQISNRTPEYQEHIKEITNFAVSLQTSFVKDSFSLIIESSNIDDIINYASEKGDWLYLTSYGYRSYKHDLANDILNFAIENNYSIVGHILHDDPKRDSKFYSLHYQCFMLNLKEWKECGKPKFGGHENKSTVLPVVIRTDENIHDDYTPLEIFSLGETKDYDGPLIEGWNIVSEFLKKGKQIGNFPQEIRKFKQHLYPENGDGLEKVLAGEEVELTDINHKNYVETTSFENFKGGVYVYNTDNMDVDYQAYTKNDILNTVYAVASGWKPLRLLEAASWNENTRMVYLDYSVSALNYRKWLVDNWDGVDYNAIIKYYKEHIDQEFQPLFYAYQDYSPEWDKHLEIFGGLENWLDIWTRYRQLEHKYLLVDLFGDMSELAFDMKQNSGNNVIWVSNSFYTEACLRNMRPKELNSKYKSFLNIIINNNKAIEILAPPPSSYKDPAFRFYGKKFT